MHSQKFFGNCQHNYNNKQVTKMFILILSQFGPWSFRS